MKTIIAPTDFSAISYNACLYAAKMAENVQADLLLLHVMELPVVAAEFPVSENIFDEAGMEKGLETLKNKLRAETNNKVNIQTKNILGSAEYEIGELCKIKNPFAVVMGTHSSSAFDRFFIGSKTIYSAKHLHYPVLVIPPRTAYKPIEKIALATDLKDIYELPSHEIENLVKTFNAELEIFYVEKNEKRTNQNAINRLLLDHRLNNLHPQFHSISHENISDGITLLAIEHKIDLLIIVPKKHGPFHKSQSNDFILYSALPVMAVHENDMAQQYNL